MEASQHIGIARQFIEGNDALAADLGVSGARLDVKPLGQGEHNVVYSLFADGRNLKRVLRINLDCQTGRADQVSREAAVLKILEPCGFVPRVFHLDDSKTRIPFGAVVLDFRKGGWLDYGNETHLREAARIMAAAHAVPVPDDCPIETPDNAFGAYLAGCERLYGNYLASSYVEPQVKRMVDELIARTRRTLVALESSRVNTPVRHLLHTEPLASQFLMPDNAPGSLIDWEKPAVGEVAQDLGYFVSPTSTIWDTDYVLSAAERDAFFDAYWRAVDGRFPQENFEQRIRAYIQTTCLRAITWSCNATVDYHNPEKHIKTERTRRLIPVYLSEEYLQNLLDNWFLD